MVVYFMTRITASLFTFFRLAWIAFFAILTMLSIGSVQRRGFLAAERSMITSLIL